MSRHYLVFIFIFFLDLSLPAQTGILSSQVGYDQEDDARVLICNEKPDFLSAEAVFSMTDLQGW